MLEMEQRPPEAANELNSSGTGCQKYAFGGLPRFPAV